MVIVLESPSWLQIVSVIFLLVGSAFCSASETALSSVSTIRLKNLVEDGNEKARRALTIAEDYDKFLTTILVGNNIVNIASASLATVIATNLVGAAYGPLVSTIAMTIIVLIFGEILPKSYAKANSEKVALLFSGVISFLIKLLKPIVWVFLQIKKLTLSKDPGEAQPYVTENELKYIIETIEGEGVLEKQESDLVQSALDFDEITAQEILTPRVDLTAINISDTPEEVYETVSEGHYSRIPVYEKSIDSIIGILYVREYLLALSSGKQPELRSLLHECPFVHKTMKISLLLNELKRSKTHLAVVTDDYGGTMGIVTMEDILEELVGDIWDESDEVENNFVEKADNLFEVSGDMNIYDMFENLDMNLKNFEAEYSTVGGWVLETLEHLPETGEAFTFENLTITVLEVEDQRIQRVLVKRDPLPSQSGEEAEE
ncbi:MAG: HlyC/CorC family transporter [Oscillospiraceae bacterium]|jgi:CBS domain containing-hemolysin-like protein|nr:HlyC/CorC family transporter [Oscillospiraceae bacterium]